MTATIQTFQGKRRTGSQALGGPFRAAALAAADVNVLFTTPLQIAPGVSGRVLVPRFLLVNKPAGTAFTLGSATHLKLHWTNAAGQELAFAVAAGLLDQSASKSAAQFAPTTVALAGLPLLTFAPAAWAAAIGAPLVLAMAGGNSSAGSPIEVSVVYESYPACLGAGCGS